MGRNSRKQEKKLEETGRNRKQWETMERHSIQKVLQKVSKKYSNESKKYPKSIQKVSKKYPKSLPKVSQTIPKIF